MEMALLFEGCFIEEEEVSMLEFRCVASSWRVCDANQSWLVCSATRVRTCSSANEFDPRRGGKCERIVEELAGYMCSKVDRISR